ncbi:L,D-transpeptidase [Enterococcus sp. AZ109]|uniref:L,D-transpeptidase n=1 Tax=Enterococcus sp. AZ109 TaxID=2774634 RepID=UPI003F262E51
MRLSRKIVTTVFILVLVSTLSLVLYFKSHFLPWAKVNDFSVGGMMISQAQKELSNKYDTLTTQLVREDTSVTLTFEDPYLLSENILKTNLHRSSFQLPLTDTIKAQVQAKIDASDFGTETASQNAVVTHSKQKFILEPEKKGTAINREQLAKKLCDDLAEGQLKETYQLSDFYLLPEVTSNDLDKTIKELNQLVKTDKTLLISKRKVHFSKEMFFASVNEVGKFDSGMIASVVQNLNREYSTIDRPVDFTNVHGSHLRFKNVGNYGWYINTEKATNLLAKQLPNNKDETIKLPLEGDPVKQPLHVKQNYIEVDLDNQKMYCFQKGKKVVATDIITGQFTKGTATVPGFHTIMDKQKDTFLSGEIVNGDGTYRVPVNYWMPFLSYGQTITEIGIHDTEHKRESFGNDQAFKTSLGSYGCINTPLDKVAEIYDYSYIGMPVFVYGHVYDDAPGEYDKPVDYGEEIKKN